MSEGDVATDLASFKQGVQSKMVDTLTTVLGNATEFVAFGSQGSFTEPSLPASVMLRSFLRDNFYAYLISHTLDQMGITITVGVDTDPVALSTNGTEIALPYQLGDCKDGQNAQGVCDAWWYSDAYSSSFAHFNPNDISTNYGATITRILASNLTTGKLLFERPYACSLNGVIGGAANVRIDSTGLNTFCINTFAPLVWDKQCHASPSEDAASNCEFAGVGEQGPFRDNVNGGHSVPYSYLGPAIAQRGSGIRRG